jgi:hypothetical protein
MAKQGLFFQWHCRGSTTVFLLPGAQSSGDVSWLSRSRVAALVLIVHFGEFRCWLFSSVTGCGRVTMIGNVVGGLKIGLWACSTSLRGCAKMLE